MSLLDRFWGFMNGMVAGWSQVFVMQPFEIIKVRLQTQSKANPQYAGIADCLGKIIKNEGPLALYKGTLTPLIGVGFMGSVRFGTYQNFKKQIAHLKGENGKPAELMQADKTLAAFGAGIVSSFLVGPVQHTRIRIQIQRGKGDALYTGSIDAAVKIAKQHGIKGLLRGQAPTLIRESTGLTFYFSFIQSITKALSPPGGDPHNVPFYVPFIAGGVGGTAYWMFNYPFDYVKTLMQSDKFGEFKYKGMMDAFRQQYAAGGWQTFYKGYLICMMRSFPVNAVTIAVYRTMQRVTKAVSH